MGGGRELGLSGRLALGGNRVMEFSSLGGEGYQMQERLLASSWSLYVYNLVTAVANLDELFKDLW